MVLLFLQLLKFFLFLLKFKVYDLKTMVSKTIFKEFFYIKLLLNRPN